MKKLFLISSLLLTTSVMANFQYQSTFDMGSGRNSNLTETEENQVAGSYLTLAPKIDVSYTISNKFITFGSANLTTKRFFDELNADNFNETEFGGTVGAAYFLNADWEVGGEVGRKFFRGREIDYVNNTTAGLESKFSYDTFKFDVWFHQDWGSLSVQAQYNEKRAETLSNDEFNQTFHDSFYEYGLNFKGATADQSIQAELAISRKLDREKRSRYTDGTLDSNNDLQSRLPLGEVDKQVLSVGTTQTIKGMGLTVQLRGSRQDDSIFDAEDALGYGFAAALNMPLFDRIVIAPQYAFERTVYSEYRANILLDPTSTVLRRDRVTSFQIPITIPLGKMSPVLKYQEDSVQSNDAFRTFKNQTFQVGLKWQI